MWKGIGLSDFLKVMKDDPYCTHIRPRQNFSSIRNSNAYRLLREPRSRLYSPGTSDGRKVLARSETHTLNAKELYDEIMFRKNNIYLLFAQMECTIFRSILSDNIVAPY